MKKIVHVSKGQPEWERIVRKCWELFERNRMTLDEYRQRVRCHVYSTYQEVGGQLDLFKDRKDVMLYFEIFVLIFYVILQKKYVFT